MERPGIADAGGATVTDEIESELIEIFLQPGLVEIIGNDARTWRERSFHRRIDAQSTLDRFFREQTRGEHHARIAGVRATRDRRDQHTAVSDLALPVMKRIARFFVNSLGRVRRRTIRHHLELCCVLRPARFLDSRLSVDGMSPSVGGVPLNCTEMLLRSGRLRLFRNRRPSPAFAAARETFRRARAD